MEVDEVIFGEKMICAECIARGGGKVGMEKDCGVWKRIDTTRSFSNILAACLKLYLAPVDRI